MKNPTAASKPTHMGGNGQGNEANVADAVRLANHDQLGFAMQTGCELVFLVAPDQRMFLNESQRELYQCVG